MKQKKSFEGKYVRHSNFRPEPNSGPSGLPIAKLLLGVIAVFFIVVAHDRFRGRGSRNQASTVALNSQAEAPPQAIEPPAVVDRPSALAEESKSAPNANPVLSNASLVPAKAPMEVPLQDEVEKPDTTVKYVMEMNRSNSFMGQGSINGKNVTLLADTGASHVVVPEKIAQRIGLKKGSPMPFKTGGGVVNHYATTLDSLTLGRIEMRNVSAAINPAMQEDFVLLGMSALGLMDMQLEQRKLVLKYKPVNVSGESLPAEQPFKRTVKECANKGNQFDKSTLDCLRGN